MDFDVCDMLENLFRRHGVNLGDGARARGVARADPSAER